MKRISAVFIGVFLLATISGNAQKNELTNCYMDLNAYDKGKDPADLAKAKIAIDKATVDPSTSGGAKTWYYRGKVYIRLYQKELADKMVAHKDMTDIPKKTNLCYYETPVTNLIESTNSFLKGKVLNNDLVDEYTQGISAGLGDCYYALQMSAIQRFSAKEYANALPMFELAVDVSASSKIFDTVNIKNTASCAYNGKIYDKAIASYQKLINVGYGKGNTWQLLARAYCESGDSAKYISTVADGLKKYPTDSDLLREDVTIKIAKGHSAEAIAELNMLADQNPKDPGVMLTVGNVYDHLATPPDSANGGKAPKPKNYDELVASAAKYYLKAIELDPKNFDANYSLGVLYYNQSVEYYNRSTQSIADAAKYKDLWEKPLPDAAKYLEAAHTLEPTDMNTLVALKACYVQMGDDTNYARVKEEIKKLQGQ